VAYQGRRVQSVQPVHCSVFGSELFYNRESHCFPASVGPLQRRSRFNHNSYLQTIHTHGQGTSLPFLTVHLLSIAPKDGINALLLNAQLGQRLFHKLIPVSDGGLGMRLGGWRGAKDDSLVTKRL
jgi:hypothetical protein